MNAAIPNPRQGVRKAGPLQAVLVLADMACSRQADPQRAVDALLDIALLACEDDASRTFVREMADEAKRMFAEDATP